jgi:hypothetical protein
VEVNVITNRNTNQIIEVEKTKKVRKHLFIY